MDVLGVVGEPRVDRWRRARSRAGPPPPGRGVALRRRPTARVRRRWWGRPRARRHIRSNASCRSATTGPRTSSAVSRQPPPPRSAGAQWSAMQMPPITAVRSSHTRSLRWSRCRSRSQLHGASGESGRKGRASIAGGPQPRDHRTSAHQQGADGVVEDPDARAAGPGPLQGPGELLAGRVVREDEVLEADAGASRPDGGEHRGERERAVAEDPHQVSVAERRTGQRRQLQQGAGPTRVAGDELAGADTVGMIGGAARARGRAWRGRRVRVERRDGGGWMAGAHGR